MTDCRNTEHAHLEPHSGGRFCTPDLPETTAQADGNHMWITAEDGSTVTYVEGEGTFWRIEADAPAHALPKQVSSLAWSEAGGEDCRADFGAYGLCIAPKGHQHKAHHDASGHRFTIPAEADPVVVQMDYADSRAQSYGILFESSQVHKIKGAKHNRYSPHRVKVWLNVFRPNPHPGEVKYNQSGQIGGDGQYLDPNNRGTDDPITVTTSAECTVISADPRRDPRDEYGADLQVGARVLLQFPDGRQHGPYLIAQRPLHDPHMIKA